MQSLIFARHTFELLIQSLFNVGIKFISLIQINLDKFSIEEMAYSTAVYNACQWSCHKTWLKIMGKENS